MKIYKILGTEQKDKNTDTTQWGQEIDQMVYKLYNLTDEEIKIIENNETKNVS